MYIKDLDINEKMILMAYLRSLASDTTKNP